MLSPAFETITTAQPADHILLVTLNRPEVGNALNTKMGEELRDLFTHYATHPNDLRCVIFTGAGEKIFCGGGDLKQRHGMDKKQIVPLADRRLAAVGQLYEPH